MVQSRLKKGKIPLYSYILTIDVPMEPYFYSGRLLKQQNNITAATQTHNGKIGSHS